MKKFIIMIVVSILIIFITLIIFGCVDYTKYKNNEEPIFCFIKNKLEDKERFNIGKYGLLKLEYLKNNPYFGRIDFLENGEYFTEEIYIGRYGFRNKKTREYEIYDWRTPIASMFYDSGIGEASYHCPAGMISGALTCKRQYKIEHGELKYCYDTNVAVQDEV